MKEKEGQTDKNKVAKYDGPKKAGGMATYMYSTEARGWTGECTGTIDTHQITRVLISRKKQLDKQAPENLEHNTKIVQKCADPDLDEDADTYSITANVAAEVPRINKPFDKAGKTPRRAATINWSAPESPRRNQTGFVRAVSGAAGQAGVSSRHRLQLLEDQAAHKELELDILRTQLLKSQRENFKLVTALNQCTGDKYSDVVRENSVLKEENERLNKQITRMWGENLRKNNSCLKKLQIEEKLDAQARKKFTSVKSPRM